MIQRKFGLCQVCLLAYVGYSTSKAPGNNVKKSSKQLKTTETQEKTLSILTYSACFWQG